MPLPAAGHTIRGAQCSPVASVVARLRAVPAAAAPSARETPEYDLRILEGRSEAGILPSGVGVPYTRLRPFHGIDTGFPPQPVVATLGVDNICALGADGDASVCGGGGTPVPEPGTLALLGVGMIGLMVGRRHSAAANAARLR